jgi:hypothetical protein
MLITPEQIVIAGFTLLKYGSLKRKESKWFVDRDKEIMRGLVKILQIAQELALANEISGEDAYAIVSAYGGSNGSEMLLPYADRLAPLIELLGQQDATPSATVTMMLQSRLPNQWLADNKGKLQDAYGITIEGNHWDASYTEDLPEETIDLLWEFVNNERNRWVLPEIEQPSNDLGEESASTENASTEMTSDTGQTATGKSNSVT